MADDLTVRRTEAGGVGMRTFAYATRSWRRERRVVARLEASTRGSDARTVVTSLDAEARYLHDDVYCARGQAENQIELDKGQLASDRTSCQSPLDNQVRLFLHIGAHRLMLARNRTDENVVGPRQHDLMAEQTRCPRSVHVDGLQLADKLAYRRCPE